MFTHLHPELHHIPSAQSIQRDGRIGIWRALNLKRLVAFTGSGTTGVFGLPTWDELALVYAECVNVQIMESYRTLPLDDVDTADGIPNATLEWHHKAKINAKIIELVQQVNDMCVDADQLNGKSKTTKARLDREGDLQLQISTKSKASVLDVLSICDAILFRLPDKRESGNRRQLEARMAFAQKLRAPEAALIREKLQRSMPEFVEYPKDPKKKIKRSKTAPSSHEKCGRYLDILRNCPGSAFSVLR